MQPGRRGISAGRGDTRPQSPDAGVGGAAAGYFMSSSVAIVALSLLVCLKVLVLLSGKWAGLTVAWFALQIQEQPDCTL